MFVVIHRETGEPVFEAHEMIVRKVNPVIFEVIPTAQWLRRFNRLVKEAGGVQPSREAMIAAINS